jgi:ribosomal protein S18 acetylase RimI-like enzyme
VLATHIRIARAADLEAILSLLAELGRPCAEPNDEHDRQAEEALGREDTEILLAERGGEIAGLASVLVLPRLGHRSPEARLLDLVVADRARGSGVGAGLVAATVERATAAGCHLLRLECGHQRVEARRFYERLDFEDRGADWQLPLPPQILI